MDNFRDSYFQVDWDLTSKRLKGTYWGKQYDTGRGFAVTVINGGQVVTPSNEVLRLKWEKPDNTSGYVNATIVDGKFIVENIDQMFTVHGSVRADFELSVGGEFVASITFYVNVEKAVAVDAIESSSDFTALQTALNDINAAIAGATVDSEVILARGTEATLGARLDSTEQDYAQHKLDYAAEINSILSNTKYPFFSESIVNKDSDIKYINIMKAVVDARIYGDIDPNKTYSLRAFARNSSSLNYRIDISEYDDLGNETKVCGGNSSFVVEENPNGVTKVIVPEFYNSGIECELIIDYSKIPNNAGYTGTSDVVPERYTFDRNVIMIDYLLNKPAGEMYNQSLNTSDDVEFNSVTTDTYHIDVLTANVLSALGELPTGTLASPPVGLLSGDVWADTTDSETQPVLRVKI